MKGYLTTLGFLLLPSILWLSKNPIDFTDPTLLAYSAGQFLGILGFTLFTLSLVLSLRLPFFERIFGNLAMSYRFHQWSGVIATVLLMVHPILLAVPTAVYFPGKLIGFFVSNQIFKLIGSAGLIVLVISIFITLFVNLPYHTWRKLHKILAVAFILGTVHGLFITGAIQFSPISKAILFIFGLLGLISICGRILFKKYLLRRTKFILDQIKVDGSVVTLTLKPKNKPLLFKAGQFVYLNIHDPAIVDEHPFTIASKAGEQNLVIMTKMLGDDTNKFGQLKVGTLIDVEGPFGNFSYALGGKRQLWIGGGIGITPFLSLAASLPPGYTVDLFYSVKTKGEEIGYTQLLKYAGDYPGLKVHLWITADQGYLNLEGVKNEGIDLSSTDDVLVCGPSVMMCALEADCHTNGIMPTHIHTEKFATRTLLPPKK